MVTWAHMNEEVRKMTSDYELNEQGIPSATPESERFSQSLLNAGGLAALSDNVLFNITEYLPPKSLANFRSSCSFFWHQNALKHAEKSKPTYVVTGPYHSILVKKGALYGKGDNTFGQLGLGKKITRQETFTLIPGFGEKFIIKVLVNVECTIVWCSDALYVMGDNTCGALGLGSEVDYQKKQTKIPFFEGKTILSVQQDSWHTIVHCTDGVYCMGQRPSGLMIEVDEATLDAQLPYLIPGLEGKAIKEVALGKVHMLFLCNDGDLYGIGGNGDGELGLGELRTQNTLLKLPFFADKTVLSIAAGWWHSLILCKEGLFSMGQGGQGQLGLTEKTRDVQTPTLVPGLEDKKILSIGARRFSSFVCCNTELLATGEYTLQEVDYHKNNVSLLLSAEKVFTPVATSYHMFGLILSALKHNLCLRTPEYITQLSKVKTQKELLKKFNELNISTDFFDDNEPLKNPEDTILSRELNF